MELLATKCSFCGVREMVRAPHRGGTINEGLVFMICPNCDGPMICPKEGANCMEPVCVDRPVSQMPLDHRAYLGVGPNSDRA